MVQKIRVGMAELNVTRSPGILITLGLGSCVGIALYDPIKKIAGLAHIMLPYCDAQKMGKNKAKYADTAIYDLLSNMLLLEAQKHSIYARIAGGAQMFSSKGSNDILKIGRRNVEAARSITMELGIPIISEATGGNYGRTLELYAETGKLLVKTLEHGVNEL